MGSSKRRFQPRSATGALAVVDRLAQSFHRELNILRLQLAPALDLGLVALLWEIPEISLGQLPGGRALARELLADVGGSLVMGASKRDPDRQAI